MGGRVRLRRSRRPWKEEWQGSFWAVGALTRKVVIRRDTMGGSACGPKRRRPQWTEHGSSVDWDGSLTQNISIKRSFRLCSFPKCAHFRRLETNECYTQILCYIWMWWAYESVCMGVWKTCPDKAIYTVDATTANS